MPPQAALFALAAALLVAPLIATPIGHAAPLYMTARPDDAERGAKAMELAFDGKWTRAAGLDIKRILDSDFTFLDGGDGSLRRLSAFLDDNRDSLEHYIKSGGHLLIATSLSSRDGNDRDSRDDSDRKGDDGKGDDGNSDDSKDDDGKNSVRDDSTPLRLPFGISLTWSDDDCEDFSALATKEGLATGVFDSLAGARKGDYFAHTVIEGDDLTSLMGSRRGSSYSTRRVGEGSLTVTTLDDDRDDDRDDDNRYALRVAQLRLAAGIRPPETTTPAPPTIPVVPQAATDIPEPGTLLLLGIGLGGLAWAQRRRG